MEATEIKSALDGIKKVIDSRVEQIELKSREHADEILMLKQRGVHMPDDTAPARQAKRFHSVNGHEVKYFAADEKLSKGATMEDFSLGSWVRDLMLGTKAASSTAVVPTGVSGSIIDRVRAKTALVEAGAGTITIAGPTNVARLTGDPTVYEHTEATADVSESDITFAGVALNPKTLMATIPLSLEVVADSPNLDDLLNTALAGAFGSKLDTLGIALILADAAVPTSSASQSCATWAGVLAAVTQALAANQDTPAAHISTTADFMARAGQLASTAGSWLGKPPALANMAELFTSSMTADTAIFGDFAAALAIAVRQELTVELVRHGKPTSGQHLLVATLRGAPVMLQPGRLFIQKTTVV